MGWLLVKEWDLLILNFFNNKNNLREKRLIFSWSYLWYISPPPESPLHESDTRLNILFYNLKGLQA